MLPSFIVRLRPTSPWRFGPDTGAREQVDPLLHSDAVYAAVTSAMGQLGRLEEWLAATARNQDGPVPVRFTSLFPYQRDTLFVVPPRSIWPPPPSMKLRYKSARFIPLTLVEALLQEKPIDEDRWQVNGDSSCLIPHGWHDGPFRTAVRSSGAVDRLEQGRTAVHRTACLEFTRDAGLWLAVVFADASAQEQWENPVRSAMRLLADSGMGGERSRGWGRSAQPRWEKAATFDFDHSQAAPDLAYWLLSVYTPAEADSVDWNRGNYSTVTRTGRTESLAGWGQPKTPTLMLAEGSVLFAEREPRGGMRDVAPDGFAHPVYRAGFPVAVRIPWRVPA